MLLDLNQKFVDTNGAALKSIQISEDDEGNEIKVITDLTLRRIVTLALTEPVAPKISGDDKVKCYNLVLKIIGSKAGMVDLESEDTTFIKNLIKSKFKVLVVGEAMFMLEGKDIGIKLLEDKKIDPPEGVDAYLSYLPPLKKSVLEEPEEPVIDKE